MNDEPARPRRRHRTRPTPAPDLTTLEGARLAYRDLAARMHVLSWSRERTVAERERWVWDEAWELARARGLPVPARRPPGQVPPPDLSRPLFPEGSRRAYRDLAQQLRLLAVSNASTSTFATRETALWRELWGLAIRRSIAYAPDHGRDEGQSPTAPDHSHL